jgi:hypothetical protein
MKLSPDMPGRRSITLGALAAGVAIASVTVAAAQGTAAKAPQRVPAHCKSSHHVETCTGARGRRGARGHRGAVGPPGPRGQRGPAGPSAEIRIPLKTIPLTTGFQTDGGNVQNLATIGPIHIDGLCRKTFAPGTGGGGAPGERQGKLPTYPAPFIATIGGETEAKVMVWTESGSLTFRGQTGSRINVPPGPPAYLAGDDTLGTLGSVDPVTGEGQHQFLAASNEPADETRATDPQVQNYAQLHGARQLARYPAFNSAGGPIATSLGRVMVAHLLAGFDAVGTYNKCFFGGYVHRVS